MNGMSEKCYGIHKAFYSLNTCLLSLHCALEAEVWYGSGQDPCLNIAHKCSPTWGNEGGMTLHWVESVMVDSVKSN